MLLTGLNLFDYQMVMESVTPLHYFDLNMYDKSRNFQKRKYFFSTFMSLSFKYWTKKKRIRDCARVTVAIPI